jgi:2'-5' RNA ligase
LSGRRKIGVAVAVPQPASGELQTFRERLGDPNASSIVPHVTLLPPTTVPALALPVIGDHLDRVAGQSTPFGVELRGAGTFRPVSPTVFVPLVIGISGCERLQAAVRSGPLARELRFPYHPHVTVAHDVPEPSLDAAFDAVSSFEATFPVAQFTLFEQRRDGTWAGLRDFVLRADDGAVPGAGADGW